MLATVFKIVNNGLGCEEGGANWEKMWPRPKVSRLFHAERLVSTIVAVEREACKLSHEMTGWKKE